MTEEKVEPNRTFFPVPESDLVKGEEFPAIDRVMAAQGYMGVQYIGRDPTNEVLYYRHPETNLKYAFVPFLAQVVKVDT